MEGRLQRAIDSIHRTFRLGRFHIVHEQAELIATDTRHRIYLAREIIERRATA